jgi:hypothetical protein
MVSDLLGIIVVDFHITDQLLSRYSKFVREKLGRKAVVRSAIYVLPLGGIFIEYTN